MRDPRTYVQSHINWAKHRPKSFIANFLTPFWQPNAYLLGEARFWQWVQAKPLERFSWIWDFKNRQIEYADRGEGSYYRVRFEDLFDRATPGQTFNQVLSFIGIPQVTGLEDRFRHRANPNKADSFPHWENWTPQMCKALNGWCKRQMDRYGYGSESVWQEKLRSHAIKEGN
ncbi:MAG: hypothetical protein HC806_02580 [Anaerolineae bacterium]|nr:hypothetical protein [Anaerolineae bacterium]